ncbi:alpha/beta-hydrolase [Stipitochalara longipes BDJ]|nr:alpha/beta-hydrolase [Stipitochalara longipes BDJ]
MDVKVRLKLVSATGARRKLGSVKLVFTRVGLSLILLVLLLYWRGLGYERALWRSWFEEDSNRRVKGWTWGEIKPSEHIVWHRCYDEYDCARLEVPLDWLDPSPSHLVTIAMIRYNATDRTNYKGPIFINPGGPGGSGIWFVKHLAPYYQSVVGKNHDIISFDPRGVGATTPSISCWNSSFSTSSLLWDIQSPPVLDAHPAVIYDAYAHASAFSQKCASVIGSGEHSIGRFVSTASVARDMLHITEKLGEQKLKYWGFSYGTFLGTTFASLWPEKVGRIVLDGNVDPKQYSSGEGTHFLADTDAVMNSFYTYCYQAGPDLCSFFSPSPTEIETRLNTFLANLKTHPVIVPASSSNNRPEIITFSKVRKLISSSLYQPLVVFPGLASALSALESGNGSTFLQLSPGQDDQLPLCDSSSSPSDPTPEIPEVEGSADASLAILCSDQPAFTGGVSAFSTYLSSCTNASTSAGATMASMRLGCVDWAVQAKWRFDGPFGSDVETKILFVGNTADNITPLRNAYEGAKSFNGSRVLRLDAYGHTSLSMPSQCTAKYIRGYFQEGTMPEEGTVCEGDLKPFQPWKSTSRAESCEEQGDVELDEALMALMKAPLFGT